MTSGAGIMGLDTVPGRSACKLDTLFVIILRFSFLYILYHTAQVCGAIAGLRPAGRLALFWHPKAKNRTI